MTALRGTITTSSPLYNAMGNYFTIVHDFELACAVPYAITMENDDGDFEEIFVQDVYFGDGFITVYLGSLELSSEDRLAYCFNIVEEDISDSFEWS